MILKNGWIIEDNQLVKKDIFIKDGMIQRVDSYIEGTEVLDCNGCLIMPGGTDVHVHLREPGYEYKETISTGTKAAAKGGFTTICAMPNLKPVPDTLEHLAIEKVRIEQDANIHVYPYAALSINQKGKKLSNVLDLKDFVCAFTDDGYGVNNLALLEEAMKMAKKYDFLICSHAEDLEWGKAPQGEYVAVRREIELAKKIGCRYHFCHLSTKESFDAVRQAIQEGYTHITCEVTPHHLFLNEEMIQNGNWKMNPPLRSKSDMEATVEALLDGTACMIASDHAPHSNIEKSQPYEVCPNGILGLETMIPLVFTHLIETKKASWNDFIHWFVENPNQVFHLPVRKLAPNYEADITCLDIVHRRKYQKDEIKSLGKNSPYIGMELSGFPRYTLVKGKVVWRQNHET